MTNTSTLNNSAAFCAQLGPAIRANLVTAVQWAQSRRPERMEKCTRRACRMEGWCHAEYVSGEGPVCQGGLDDATLDEAIFGIVFGVLMMGTYDFDTPPCLDDDHDAG